MERLLPKIESTQIPFFTPNMLQPLVGPEKFPRLAKSAILLHSRKLTGPVVLPPERRLSTTGQWFSGSILHLPGRKLPENMEVEFATSALRFDMV